MECASFDLQAVINYQNVLRVQYLTKGYFQFQPYIFAKSVIVLCGMKKLIKDVNLKKISTAVNKALMLYSREEIDSVHLYSDG